MKRLIYSGKDAETFDIDFDRIVSIVLVDDLSEYSPGLMHVVSSEKSFKLNYSDMTKDQIMQLSDKERSKIRDVDVLRKLDFSELTPAQQVLVGRANDQNFKSSIQEVKSALEKLKKCNAVHIWSTDKNDSFFEEIASLGGEVTDIDARNIVRLLNVKDYSYSTRSRLKQNWNSILMVFEFRDEYTFEGYSEGASPVTVSDLDIYIKIDVDKKTRNGYAAMSFHHPDNKMAHPYKDYPVTEG